MHRGFLIQRVHDLGAKRRGSVRVGRITAQHRAHLLKVLQQRPALGAMLDVPLNIGGGNRVDLGVEVSLHAQ